MVYLLSLSFSKVITKMNICACRSDDSADEIDDQEVNKILIITQTPPAFRKHPGGDRTGDHVPRYINVLVLATNLLKRTLTIVPHIIRQHTVEHCN